jgi:hypothetical protein
VDSTIENRISAPPMVGVPAFDRWLSGPSLRIGWPACCRTSRRMNQGPSNSEISMAVSAASTVRRVM